MPGLSQLKQFNSDILSLGGEPELRAKRGEKPVTFPLPKGVKDIDDSNDFVMGMPEPVNNGPVQKKKEEPEDFSDIMGTASPSSSSDSSSGAGASESAGITLPDLSIINTNIPSGEGEDAGPDLSMFMDEEPEEEPVVEEPVERQIDEFSLDELLGGAGFDGSEGYDENNSGEENPSEDSFNADESFGDDSSSKTAASASQPSSPAAPEFSSEATYFDESVLTGNNGAQDSLDSALSAENLSAGAPSDSDSGLSPAILAALREEEQKSSPSDNFSEINDDELLNKAFPSSPSVSSDGIEELDAMDFAPGDSFSADDLKDLESSLPEDNLLSALSGSGDSFGGADLASAGAGGLSDFDGLSGDLSGGTDLGAGTASGGTGVTSGGMNDASGGTDAASGGDGLSGLDDLSGFGDSAGGSGEFSGAGDSTGGSGDVSGAGDLPELGDLAGGAGDLPGAPGELSGADDFSGLGDLAAPGDLSGETDSLSGSDILSGSEDAASAGSFGDAVDLSGSDGLSGTDDFGALGDLSGLGDLAGDAAGGAGDASGFGDLSGLDDLAGGADSLSDGGDSFGSLDAPGADAGAGSAENLSLDSGFDLPPDISGSFDSDSAGLSSEASGDASSDLDAQNPFGSDFGLDDFSQEELTKQAEETEPFKTSDFGSDDTSALFNSDTLDTPDFSAGASDSGADLGSDTGIGGDALSNGSPSQDALDMLASGGSIDMSLPEEGMDDFGSGGDFGGDFGSGSAGEGGSSKAKDSDDDSFLADFNFDMDDLPSDGDAGSFEEGPVTETFDISGMEGMEFPDTDAQINSANGDFEFNTPDSMMLDNGDFEIPGYTGDNILDEKQQEKLRQKKEEPEEQAEDELPPNTLSDDQYKVFLENLSTYPLNVRIAVEDLMVKNEFTDDAEFEIVSKVLKKVPARNLASELEKMLDIPISVPRDYEKRTAAEYEAYKSSFQYQLRNKIIPAAILGILGILVSFALFISVRNFIYRPARASSLYRQGYAYLEAEDFPQSEIKFNEATRFKVKKPWFYKYAHGYIEHKQYIRAEQMYNVILQRFKHEKQAGLEYAQMELDELANYAQAEEILLREVLDFHINDPDGLLLLGDTYLEWATEKDPSKFEEARIRYAELLQLYGGKSVALANTYRGRLMRYFVRTDNLLEVLQLKDSFMPKKNSLDSEGWTEMSGFLLEKLYGPLPPKEEYLRTKIEDVKEMLMRAVNSDENNPVALYNLGKYYVYMNDGDHARSAFQRTIKAFDSAEKIKKRDMYKFIDSYRLFGEQYMDIREYLKAREQFTDGITLYQNERDANGFEGNQKIGKLYQDMGDIDYFIQGDMNSALVNYENSIQTQNDLPEIRYKVGYIKYNSGEYTEALGSFFKACEEYPDDVNLLLAMGNTLSLKGNNNASQGYYEHLLEELGLEIDQKKIMFPQAKASSAEIVDNYMKATNNLGVTFYRLAKRTGNSLYNAKAMVNFQESLRAWDTLTRNLETMNRLSGSNLAEQNLRYTSQPRPEYEPQIYTKISKTLFDEDVPN